MGDQKNLGGSEAVQKMRSLIDDENICMFATRLTQLPLDARPMATAKVDDDGSIWFISKSDSGKNKDIELDKRVQLFYSNKSGAEFLSVYGEAEISKDKSKIDELWKPIDKAWFEQGKDDPTVTVIRVTPSDAYYWDTKSNRLVCLIKIASAAITGNTSDGGVEGSLAFSHQK